MKTGRVIPAFRLSVVDSGRQEMLMDAGIQERLSDFIRRKGLRRDSKRDTIVKAAFSFPSINPVSYQ